MGIVVSSEKLRPYHNVPQSESDPESGHVSINLEVPFTKRNGVFADTSDKFANKRWGKMFSGTKQHRLAPQRNAK